MQHVACQTGALFAAVSSAAISATYLFRRQRLITQTYPLSYDLS